MKIALGERPTVDKYSNDLGTIIGVHNQDGEIIEFENEVKVTTSIEEMLLKVEQEMKFAVAATILDC